MKLRFVLTIALRYLRSGRKEKKATFSLFSIAGISVGVMTLIVVMGVMNGFQLSFIRPALEVRSYHLQIQDGAGRTLPESVIRAMEREREIEAVVPFYEIQAIAGLKRSCIVRALHLEAADQDVGFVSSFDPELQVPGTAVLSEPDTVILGAELAAQLGLYRGDTVGMAVIYGGVNVFAPVEKRLRIAGVFRTGFYDIDLNWAFVSLDTGRALGGERLVYGVKLVNRYRDEVVVKRLQGMAALRSWSAESWREFNRVFFGALATEKSSMGLLIGLIFLVVGFNIYNALRRSVNERLEEIATLKAVGGSTSAVRGIFLLEGVIIGMVGSLIGTVLGLLLTTHVNGVFHFVERAANDWLFPLVGGITGFTPPPVAIFSPSVFYISGVPVHVYLHEVLLIGLFALGSASISAFFASRGVVGARPAVLLRSE